MSDETNTTSDDDHGGLPSWFAPVCMVIGILSVILPVVAHYYYKHRALERAKLRAQQTEQFHDNLRQIGAALKQYHDEYYQYPSPVANQSYQPHQGWQTGLLWFMGHEDVASQIDHSEAWDSAANRPAASTEIPEFLNPLEETRTTAAGFAVSHYAGNQRAFRANRPLNWRRMSDYDSNTIAAGEVSDGIQAWADPRNLRDPAAGLAATASTFGSRHVDESAFLMFDGSVKVIQHQVDARVLQALATPNGNDFIRNPNTATIDDYKDFGDVVPEPDSFQELQDRAKGLPQLEIRHVGERVGRHMTRADDLKREHAIKPTHLGRHVIAFSVRNQGTAPLTIKVMPMQFIDANTQRLVLEPRKQHTIALTVQGDYRQQAIQDKMILETNDPRRPKVTVTITYEPQPPH